MDKSSRQISSVSNIELYDRWAKSYDTDGNILQAIDDQEIPSLLSHLFALLSSTVPPPKAAAPYLHITELGSGTGRNTAKLLSPTLAPSISSIQALDLSPSMLRVAQTRCAETLSSSPPLLAKPALDFHIFNALDATPPPHAAQNAHAVLSTLVLEHLPLETFFRTVKALLRGDGGGYLLVTNMHAEMGRRSRAGFVDEQTGEKVQGMSFVYEVGEVLEEGRKWGFEVVGGVRERVVEEEDLVSRVVGGRGRKWVGCRVWFGCIMRLMGSV